MPASEFAEWTAMYSIQPFGVWRDNYHAAMVAHILATAHSDPKKPKPRFDAFFYTDPKELASRKRRSIVNFFRSKVAKEDDG